MHYLLVPKLVYVSIFTSAEIFDNVKCILGMVCFMTYSVYSLSFSSLFPAQSQYIMMITLFFLLSIFWTFVSLAWFVVYNHYSSKGEMPKLLYAFCGRLQRILCCCFSPPKPNEKADANKDIIENGPVTTNGANSKCLPCFRRRVQVETIATRNDVFVVETGSARTNRNEAPDVAKPKCDFCDRCETCQGDFDKDKTKGKNKKDVESKCNALNYLVLFVIFLLMVGSNIGLWLVMST